LGTSHRTPGLQCNKD